MMLLMKRVMIKCLSLMLILVLGILSYNAPKNQRAYVFNPKDEGYGTYYRIEARLDEDANRLYVKEWIRFVNTSNRSLEKLYLKIGNEGFNVEKVRVNEHEVQQKMIDKDSAWMKLSGYRPIIKNTTTFIEVEGAIDIAFDDVIGEEGKPHYLKGWYPVLGYYDETGWSLDFEGTGKTQIAIENDYDIFFISSKNIFPVFEGEIVDQRRGFRTHRYHIKTTKAGEVKAVMMQ